MIILAIETSCDETAAAILKDGQILASEISSQAKIHAQYGGVVPEVSARNHLENILPIIDITLKNAQATLQELDAIAVTKGPGLVPSLLIGIDTAKVLSFALQKPLITVNHLEGHAYSVMPLIKDSENIFPLIMLLVSGGHTEIILMKDHGKYELLGQTIDDAAGEAFDKVAKMLGLAYPGGPEVAKRANLGNSKSFQFVKPLIQKDNLDFSFSGLKTDVLRTIQRIEKKRTLSEKDINNICASFQRTVVEILIEKLLRATKKYNPKTITLTGGVSANTYLRKKFLTENQKENPEAQILIPEQNLTTDNAAMIAYAAAEKYKRKEFATLEETAEPNLKLAT